MNLHIITGNLGGDVEVKTLDSGHRVATVSLAETEHRKKKDSAEFEKITHWHNLIAWNHNADKMANNYGKGDKVVVNGKTRTRTFENDAGVKMYRTETVIDSIELHKKGGQTAENLPEPPPESIAKTDADDDLPF
jgi:single-strand DNA-binding protein